MTNKIADIGDLVRYHDNHFFDGNKTCKCYGHSGSHVVESIDDNEIILVLEGNYRYVVPTCDFIIDGIIYKCAIENITKNKWFMNGKEIDKIEVINILKNIHVA